MAAVIPVSSSVMLSWDQRVKKKRSANVIAQYWCQIVILYKISWYQFTYLIV